MTHELDSLINHDAFRMKLNEVRLIQKYEQRYQDLKVSVIMPTWNRAFVIGRAIDSVLQQSYRNFELIISDDGSSDGTEDMIQKLCKNEKRIHYVRNAHMGVGHARNVALKQAQGELIAYLDSDNMWSGHYLLLMVNTFVDCPEYYALYCAMRYIDEPGDRDYILFRQYERKSLLERNFIDINVFMHRRSLFEKLHGFNNAFNGLEDWELVIRYTKEYRPKALECCLVTYHRNISLSNLTLTKDLEDIYQKIRQLYAV